MMKRIRVLVLDVDGTLTDGKIYIGPKGEVFKAFNVKDGYGIHSLLPILGIEPVIITGRKSEIVQVRALELGINEVHQNIGNKLKKLMEILDERGLDFSNVAYMGDDINDLECISMIKQKGGVTGCPNDAEESLICNVDFVAKRNGGEGAVREFISYLTKFNEKD